ncbi:MAG: DUF4149 domain-containing protein [Caldimonas sp.]
MKAKAKALGGIGAVVGAGWAGIMVGVGIAASTAFSLLPRADAGRLATRLFSIEATVGVCLGAALALLALQIGRQRAESGEGSRFGAELMLALAALACLVGYYALLPLIESARGGTGPLSFGALHAIASALFAIRLAIVLALAWRLAAPER